MHLIMTASYSLYIAVFLLSHHHATAASLGENETSRMVKKTLTGVSGSIVLVD